MQETPDLPIETHMNRFANRASVIAGCLILAGCVAAHEQSTQHEAVEYQVQQRDSTRCADLGMLPGSDEFNACMAKLEGAPQSATH